MGHHEPLTNLRLNNKLGRAVDMLEDRSTIQNDFWRRLNILADRNFTQFKKHKCRVLQHLQIEKTGCTI